MVSTRQMSSVGGGGGSEGMGVSGEAGVAVLRVTRHSSALLPPPGGSSPHAAHSASGTQPAPPAQPAPHAPPGLTLKCTSLQVHGPKTFTTNLLDLPIEVIEKILSYLGYKSVSQLRLINRQFNTISSSILNSTFQRLQNQMLHRFQAIKAKMPRRESARRSHPLACESDIIETLHMRLSLLQMTFGKHIERKHCCFFPGEILDEVYSILSYLKTTTKLARPYKVTDELFDLTTMAMEYFKEHIEPNLPEITYFGTDFFDITTAFSPGESSKSYMCLDSPPPAGFEGGSGGCGAGGGGGGESSGPAAGERRVSALNMYLEESLPPSPPPPQSNMVLRKRIHRIKQGMKKYNDQLSALRSDLRSCKRKTALQQKQIAEQQKQIAEQQKQTLEYANRLDDYDKKNEETSRKFQTLLQELNKCKTELQYWRSRSPAVPPLCAECGAALQVPASTWAAGMNDSDTLEETAGGSGEVSPIVAPEVDTPVEQPKEAPKAKDKEPTKDTNCKKEVPKETCKKEPSKEPNSERPRQKEPVRQKEVRSESSGEEALNTPPSRRRASADATNGTPDRKKRRLTRPRKL